jgi:hypothetical protein
VALQNGIVLAHAIFFTDSMRSFISVPRPDSIFLEEKFYPENLLKEVLSHPSISQ